MKRERSLIEKKDVSFPLHIVRLSESKEKELQEISKTMGLALSIPEMKRIKSYFSSKNREPTDVELQALGQAWSEHCCYKSSKIPLKKHIYGIEEDRIVAREDAGVTEFDDDHYYVAALESHNHPSAIEPYGGAATGIGGIVRDVVCMGAQPVAFIDPLFFGPLDCSFDELPEGVKHPRFLFKGVVDGIRDYGNRIGIPTVCGQVHFHEGYVGNCLVNVGCIGVVPKSKLIRSRAKKAGNIYVYVGGKTGRDGMHGVTFASAELTEESEEGSRSAVQVGDPITKEPLIHATLECNNKGILEGLKDFGGGGLSCVCGELAHDAGLGAEIHLDDVPLKEEDMSPWEIWVSESQERMMFLVNPGNLDEVLHICKQWDVFATPIGKVIEEPITRVYYQDEKILELENEFQTGGPVYDTCRRPYKVAKKKTQDEEFALPDVKKGLLKLLSFPLVASKEWVVRQYDHEVRGNTVVKPLQGKVGLQTHGDASVIKPLEESSRGLAITADVNPHMLDIDPYWGACSAVDEACRNLVAVGARPDSLADCLNFGNPEKPERMGEFYEACQGLGDMAKELKLPFISGNVSFYNESAKTVVPPTPAILGIGLVKDIRKCITADFKTSGNSLYILGDKTREEMGGSAYYALLGKQSSKVPRVKVDVLKKSIECLLNLIDKEILASCHDVSEGGIAVCLSEMALGGDLGAEIDVSSIASFRIDKKLFSESNTRWIVEVKNRKEEEFKKYLEKHGVYAWKIGKVGRRNLSIRDRKESVVDVSLSEIRRNWRKTIWDAMG